MFFSRDGTTTLRRRFKSWSGSRTSLGVPISTPAHSNPVAATSHLPARTPTFINPKSNYLDIVK